MSSPQPYNSTSLSPTQANFIYWLNGLAPVLTNIVTPLVVYHKMSKANVSDVVRYNQLVNEIGRQFVSGTIGLLSYFGGGELTRGLMNMVFGRNQGNPWQGMAGPAAGGMDEASRQIAMTVGGVLMSFVGFAFIRPLISTSLICNFLKAEGVRVSLKKEEAEAIIDGAKDSVSNIFHADKAKSLLEEKIRHLTAQQLGSPSNSRLLNYLQRKVDEHLVPDGKPNVKKTAVYSTVLLSGYLGMLTGLLWGVNRMLGGKTLGTSSLGGAVAMNGMATPLAGYSPPFQGMPSQSMMSSWPVSSPGRGYGVPPLPPALSPWR